MPTKKQELGERGERYVARNLACPGCKREHSLKRLPTNFKCADLVCDFCGYLAQVKTKQTKNLEKLPSRIPGGAWGVQKERMDAGIYFPLFVVLVNSKPRYAVYFLSADLQIPDMFIERKPLKKTAKRAGWKGFYYDLTQVDNSIVRLR